MLQVLGWIIAGALVGAVAVACLAYFWDEIRQWLNTTALDVVERHLGYKARFKMQCATTVITRIGNRLFNKTIVISRVSDKYYDKVMLFSEDDIRNADPDVLEELKRQGRLEQKYLYNDGE